VHRLRLAGCDDLGVQRKEQVDDLCVPKEAAMQSSVLWRESWVQVSNRRAQPAQQVDDLDVSELSGTASGNLQCRMEPRVSSQR